MSPARGAATRAPERDAPVQAQRLVTVLVVGTDDWAAQQSAQSLRSAGHRVLTCHEPGEPAFPCNALIKGRTCPLEAGFDVVLTARARPTPVPADGEMGVICGLREGAPLVTAGISAENPFGPWSAGAVGPEGDLSATCQAAAASRVFDLRRNKR